MEEKKWYLSKGFWGSLVVLVITVLTLLGRTGEADIIKEQSGAISETMIQLVTIAFAALAFIGRIVAKSRLTT